MKEQQLRDYLRDHLDLIEPGLYLLGTEVFLPNDNGSPGRIDILARDQRGMYVPIELKQARSSSRETIQQLGKYVRLLTDAAIPRSRIRCIVISSDWGELLAPFTELAETFPCRLTGYCFSSDENVFPCDFERIEPLPFRPPIELSPDHFIILAQCEEQIEQELKTAESLFTSVDLLDFVVFIFEYDAQYILYFVLQAITEKVTTALVKATGTTIEADGSPTLFGRWEYAAFFLIARGHGRDNVEPAHPGTLVETAMKYPLHTVRKYGCFNRVPGVWTDRDLLLDTIRRTYGDPENDGPPSPELFKIAREIHKWGL